MTRLQSPSSPALSPGMSQTVQPFAPEPVDPQVQSIYEQLKAQQDQMLTPPPQIPTESTDVQGIFQALKSSANPAETASQIMASNIGQWSPENHNQAFGQWLDNRAEQDAQVLRSAELQDWDKGKSGADKTWSKVFTRANNETQTLFPGVDIKATPYQKLVDMHKRAQSIVSFWKENQRMGGNEQDIVDAGETYQDPNDRAVFLNILSSSARKIIGNQAQGGVPEFFQNIVLGSGKMAEGLTRFGGAVTPFIPDKEHKIEANDWLATAKQTIQSAIFEPPSDRSWWETGLLETGKQLPAMVTSMAGGIGAGGKAAAGAGLLAKTPAAAETAGALSKFFLLDKARQAGQAVSMLYKEGGGVWKGLGNVATKVGEAAYPTIQQTGFWTSQIAPDLEQDLKKSGLDASVARPAAILTAAVEGVIENLNARQLLGPEMERLGVGGITRYALSTLDQTGKEVSEEFLQAATEVVGKRLATLTNEKAKFSWADEWKDIEEQMKQVVLPVAIMQAPGAAITGVQHFQAGQERYGEMLRADALRQMDPATRKALKEGNQEILRQYSARGKGENIYPMSEEDVAKLYDYAHAEAPAGMKEALAGRAPKERVSAYQDRMKAIADQYGVREDGARVGSVKRYYDTMSRALQDFMRGQTSRWGNTQTAAPPPDPSTGGPQPERTPVNPEAYQPSRQLADVLAAQRLAPAVKPEQGEEQATEAEPDDYGWTPMKRRAAGPVDQEARMRAALDVARQSPAGQRMDPKQLVDEATRILADADAILAEEDQVEQQAATEMYQDPRAAALFYLFGMEDNETPSQSRPEAGRHLAVANRPDHAKTFEEHGLPGLNGVRGARGIRAKFVEEIRKFSELPRGLVKEIARLAMSDTDALTGEAGGNVKIDQTWRKYPAGSNAPGMVFHDTPFGRFGRREIPGDPELTPFTYEEAGNWVASLQNAQNAPESIQAPVSPESGTAPAAQGEATPVAQPTTSEPSGAPPVDSGPKISPELQAEMDKARQAGDLDKVLELMERAQAEASAPPVTPSVTAPAPPKPPTAGAPPVKPTTKPAAPAAKVVDRIADLEARVKELGRQTKAASDAGDIATAQRLAAEAGKLIDEIGALEKAKSKAAPEADAEKKPEAPKPKSAIDELTELMQSPRDWRDAAVQIAAGSVSLSTEVTLPDLYDTLKARFPGLTHEEFRRGMQELADQKKLVLGDYTRAAADVENNPAAIRIPADRFNIYDRWKFYVRAMPPKITAQNPKPSMPQKPKAKTAEDVIYESHPKPVQAVIDEVRKAVNERYKSSFVLAEEPEAGWTTLAMDLAERISGKTGQARSMPVVWFRGNLPASGLAMRGVVFLNADLPRPDQLWDVIAHEVSHILGVDESLKLDDPELMDQLRQEYYDISTPGTQKLLREKKSLWDEEAIAYLVGRLFRNPDFRRQMQYEKPTLWAKIVAAFRRFFERFRASKKWDANNPLQSLAQKHIDKIEEVFLGTVPKKVSSLTTVPEVAPSKFPELDDLMFSPMKDVAQYLRDRYKATANEEKFFSRYMQDALRALQVQVSARTRKGNISKTGIRRAVDKYMEDVSSYLDANPNLAEYYANEAHRERSELVKVFPELQHDEVWAGYRMLNGMGSAQTNLGENTQETIDLWALLREKGEIPITKVKGDDGKLKHAGDGFVVHGGPSSRNKINNYRAFNKLLKQHGSVGEVAAFLTGSVSREGLLELRKKLGWATIGEIGPILDTVRHATGQTDSIPRMFIFGPKVGAYILNRMGDSRYQTIDVWESRLARFYLSDIRFKPGQTGLLEGDDRKIAQEFGKLVAEELGLDPAAAQAVRWYHFKGFVKELGYGKVKDEDLKTLSEITAGRLAVREGDGGEGAGAAAGRTHAIIRGSGRGIEARRRAAAEKIRDNLGSERRPVELNDEVEEEIADDTLYFSPREKPDPVKTQEAYKLFRTDSRYPGKLFPLFVNADKSVDVGTWQDAEIGPLTPDNKVKSRIGKLAYRPGWHAGDLPVATHIGGKTEKKSRKPNYRPNNQVWALVEFAADVDWQKEADSRARINKRGKPVASTAHITDQLPVDGFYRYKTNPNMVGQWLIGGSMKVIRVLSDSEVKAINDKAGVADLPRLSDDGTLMFSPRVAETPAERMEKQKKFNKVVAKYILEQKRYALYRDLIKDLIDNTGLDKVLKYEQYLKVAWNTARALMPDLNLVAAESVGDMFPTTIHMVGEPVSDLSKIYSQASSTNRLFIAMDDDNEQIASVSPAAIKTIQEALKQGGSVHIDLGSWKDFASAQGKGWVRVVQAVGKMLSGLDKGQVGRINVILPDVFGNQTESHQLQKVVAAHLRPLADAGITFVVPIQKGDESLRGYVGWTTDGLHLPPTSLVFGIPIGGRQWSQENVIEFVSDEADNAVINTRIHLMGVSNKEASSIASYIKGVNPKAVVTGENSQRHRGEEHDHLEGLGRAFSNEMRKARLKLKKEGDVWYLTDNNETGYKDHQGIENNQKWIRNIGGVWDQGRRGYKFQKDPRQDIYNNLTRRKRELEEAKRREEARADLSILSKPATEIVSKETQDAINAGSKAGVTEDTLKGQIEDIARISEAISNDRRAFILAAGTGTGKTFVLGGVVREALEKFPKVIWVTKNKELVAQAKKDIKVFGIDEGKIEFMTYAGLSVNGAADAQGALLIFDESHEINNFIPDENGVDRRATRSDRAVEAQGMIKAAQFTIFSSATPMRNPVDAGYIASTGLFDRVGGFVEWAQIYGADIAKTSDNTLTVHWARGGRESLHRTAEARRWLLRQGVFSKQKISLPKGLVHTIFRTVKLDSPTLKRFNDVMAAYQKAMADNSHAIAQIKRHSENVYKRLTEFLKAPAAIKEAQRIIEAGGQVVVFTDYKSESWIGRYQYSERYRKEHGIKDADSELFKAEVVVAKMEAWRAAAAEAKKHGGSIPTPPFADEIYAIAKACRDLGLEFKMDSTLDLFADAFSPGDIGYFTGPYEGERVKVTAKSRVSDKEKWLKNKKKILVATIGSGGTGLSLHDTTGTMPTRMQLGIALPWTGVATEQAAGRLARQGIKKETGIVWMFAEGITFEKTLAARVGARLNDMGGLLSGIENPQGSALEDFDFEGDFDPLTGGVARELSIEAAVNAQENDYGFVQGQINEEGRPEESEESGQDDSEGQEDAEGDDVEYAEGVDEGVTEKDGFKIDDQVEFADPGLPNEIWVGSVTAFKGDSAWVAVEDEEFLVPLSWLEHIEDAPSIDDIPVDKPTPPVPPKADKQAGLFDIEADPTEGIYSIDPQKVQVAPGMQFKKGADKSGITPEDKISEKEAWKKEFAGTFLFWQANDGTVYVADGHHRLAHAKAKNAPVIYGFLKREQDGFTFQQARALAALINIKNGKGRVYDHAAFFRDSEITQEQAFNDGLLSKDMARTGFLVGRFAADAVYEAFLNEDLTPEKAAIIADIGRDSLPVQAVGLFWAKTKKQPPGVFETALRIWKELRDSSGQLKPKEPELKQRVMFEDYEQSPEEARESEEAEKVARVIEEIKSGLRDTIRRHNNLLRDPDKAKREDVSFSTQTSESLIEKARLELYEWTHSATDRALMERARLMAGLPPKATDGLGQEVASSYGGSGGRRGRSPYKGTGAAPANQPSTSFPFTPSQVQNPIPIGFLYDLALAIMGSAPEIKRLRGALGMAIHKEMLGVEHMRILIDPSAAIDPDLLRKVLAHEIGHIDDVIDPNSPALNTIKRGNLVGRIFKLRKFLQGQFQGLRNNDLKRELIALTEWWSGPIAGSQSYVRYRRSSRELYAEFLSVFLVSPGEAQARAPEFYSAFTQALDLHKPFKQELLAIQATLAGSPDAEAERMGRVMSEMWGEGQDAFLAHRKAINESIYRPATQVVTSMLALLLDTNAHAQSMAKSAVKEGVITEYERREYLATIDDLHHINSPGLAALGRFMQYVTWELEAANLPRSAFDDYMYQQRVMGDPGRQDKPNPKATDAQAAAKSLAKMEKDLGPVKWAKLVQIGRNASDMMFSAFEEGYREGLFTDEMMDQARLNRYTYMPFVILEYYNGWVHPGVKEQHGTFLSTAPASEAITKKIMSMQRAIVLNRAKRKTMDLAQKSFKYHASRLQTDNLGNLLKGQKIKSDLNDVLWVWEGGKEVPYEVDKFIVEMFKTHEIKSLEAVVNAISNVIYSVWHPLFVTFSPKFMYRNFFRDPMRSAIGIPAYVAGIRKDRMNYLIAGGMSKTAAQAATKDMKVGSLELLFKYYGPAAIKTWAAKKKKDAAFFAHYLEKGVFSEQIFTEPAHRVDMTDKTTELDKMFQEAGYQDIPDSARAAWRQKIAPLMRPIKYTVAPWLLRNIGRLNQVFELTSKVASTDAMVDAGLPDWAVKVGARKHAGTPDIMQRGRMTGPANALSMYFKVKMVGLASDASLAFNPSTAFGWWWRTAIMGIAPVIANAIARMFWPGYKEAEDKIGDYLRKNYLCLFWPGVETSDGKQAVVTIPMDETTRFVHSVTTNLFDTMRAGDDSRKSSLWKMFKNDWGAMVDQVIPSYNPAITILGGWKDFLADDQPMDKFYKRPIINDRDWALRDEQPWDGVAKMASWTMRQMGVLDIAYQAVGSPFSESYYGAEEKPWYSSAWKITGLDALVRATDQGLSEIDHIETQQSELEGHRFRSKLTPKARSLSQEYEVLRNKKPGDLSAEEKTRKESLRAWMNGTYTPIRQAIQNAKEIGLSDDDVKELYKSLNDSAGELRVLDFDKARDLNQAVRIAKIDDDLSEPATVRDIGGKVASLLDTKMYLTKREAEEAKKMGITPEEMFRRIQSQMYSDRVVTKEWLKARGITPQQAIEAYQVYAHERAANTRRKDGTPGRVDPDSLRKSVNRLISEFSR